MMQIKVPKDVQEILNTIRAAGHEAYIVGGCVRDAILETEPKDWDITTSALPEQVKSLFPHTVDTVLITKNMPHGECLNNILKD